MVEKQLNVFIHKHFHDYEEVKILEAGCGSAVSIELLKNYVITGIDISTEQLERNQYITDRICADLQTYSFERNSFDIIISWYVLEHIKDPKKVLLNFTKALKTNGLIILALPNLWSVKGIVTKYTPLFIHIWFYRYVLKYQHAGNDDHGPFKTYLKYDISPYQIKKFAIENNYEIAHFSYNTFPGFQEKIKKKPLIAGIQLFVNAIFRFFSFGKITVNNTDFVIVLKNNNMN